MKNKIVLTSFLLLLVAGFSFLEGKEKFTLGEDIIVAKEDVQDSIVSFGGDVLIEGLVKRDVVVIGGTVTISGEVRNAVVGIGSPITLKSTAIVNGDLVSIGGVLNKEPGCVVEGDTVYFKSSDIFSKSLREGLKGIFSLSLIPLILILKLVSFFIWLVIALVVAALFPRQISFASTEIRKSFWPVFGTGFLSLVIFTGLVIISILLCFVLIGIPLLLGLIMLGIVIKILGRVILFYFFGESLSRALGGQKTSPLLATVLGLVLVSIVSLIPFFGFLFSFCLSVIGWGVVVRTKFGTCENWFRKKGQ